MLAAARRCLPGVGAAAGASRSGDGERRAACRCRSELPADVGQEVTGCDDVDGVGHGAQIAAGQAQAVGG